MDGGTVIGGARPRPGHAAARRARHLRYLLGDVWWTARINKMWWLIPALLVLLVAIAAAGAAQTTVPYAVYTLL